MEGAGRPWCAVQPREHVPPPELGVFSNLDSRLVVAVAAGVEQDTHLIVHEPSYRVTLLQRLFVLGDLLVARAVRGGQ